VCVSVCVCVCVCECVCVCRSLPTWARFSCCTYRCCASIWAWSLEGWSSNLRSMSRELSMISYCCASSAVSVCVLTECVCWLSVCVGGVCVY